MELLTMLSTNPRLVGRHACMMTAGRKPSAVAAVQRCTSCGACSMCFHLITSDETHLQRRTAFNSRQ